MNIEEFEITDEEQKNWELYIQKEYERLVENNTDPLTGDYGDPYRNVRDDDKDGQYDYMQTEENKTNVLGIDL
jgi:hypothetical protein